MYEEVILLLCVAEHSLRDASWSMRGGLLLLDAWCEYEAQVYFVGYDEF